MNEYLRRATRIVDLARKDPHWTKPECKNCKWHHVPGFITAHCKNPIVIIASESLRSAWDQQRTQNCDVQRLSQAQSSRPVVCGPNGALFEEREDLIYRFKQFIQWLKEGGR